MASTLPNPSDCCTLCEGLSVELSNLSFRQVYLGSGDPNTAALVPDDPTLAALYYNTDVPGELWNWDTDSQTWF